MPNIDQDMQQSGDILSTLDGVSKRADTQTKLLSSIDANLGQLIQEFSRMSSANAINSYGDGKGGYSYGRSNVYNKRVSRQRSSQGSDIDDAVDEITSGITSRVANSILNNRGLNNIVNSVINDLKRPIREKMESSIYDLLDGIEHSLKRGAGSADISKRIKSSLESLASDLGVETQDIGKGIGKLLGQKLLQNADVKAVADFSKQFAQTQIRNIRAAYQSGKVGQIQDMPDLIRRQTLRDSLSDLPDESERVKEYQRITFGDGNAREELLRQNAEKVGDKYIRDPSDLSETEATGRSKLDSGKNNDTQSQIKSANDLTINAQSCVISTDNLDINIEGSGLDELFNRNYDSDTFNIQGAVGNPELVDISETNPSDSIRKTSRKDAEMDDISTVLSDMMDTVNTVSDAEKQRYARASNDLELQDFIQSMELDRSEASNEYQEFMQSFENSSNTMPGVVDKSELSDIGDRSFSGKSKPSDMQGIYDDEMQGISNSEIVNSVTNPALSGLENATKYIQDGISTLAHSNRLTGSLYDFTESSSSSLFGKLSQFASNAYSSGKGRYMSEMIKVGNGAMQASEMSGLGGMISTLTGGATEAGAALSGVTSVIGALGPAAIAATAAIAIVGSKLKKSFEPAIDGTKKAMDAVSTSMHRMIESAKKNIETSQKRIMDDVRTLVETPFNILKEAAQDWYNAWDSNIRTINQTQGYTKSDLQDLMASFADRLRSEGLTSVVAATDITNNLTKVLQSGLSGQIAEEFAYLATKLNAAVPTQDFFSYADTYASIAANAVRAGATQSAAIEEASQQLIAFANNVLYASREVAGGFTTGLQNAESLFKQSVQISQAAKSYNASEISGVMTSVSAIVGAIAPDVASSLTDAIYKAAVGGNSNEIVALRSLAGINASNTEFLQQIATDAKTVFSDLFEELGKRQNMSESGYMEVAEGLSSIFGLSMDAFARVDFNYLAQAIESMDTSSAALSDNIMLLASGESTTNAEQLKMQQINKMILDEGLSYVLDNEAARAIQEHMWDEQLTRQLQETEYGVTLHGAALEFLEGIKATLSLVLDVLNPFRLIGRVSEVVATAEEFDALRSDVSSVLELGKVGSGNSQQLYNLTHTNEDLNVTSNLVSLLGGTSEYASTHANSYGVSSFIDRASSPLGLIPGLLDYSPTGNMVSESEASNGYGGTSSDRFGGSGGAWADSSGGRGLLPSQTSKYSYSSIGKSEASAAMGQTHESQYLPDRSITSNQPEFNLADSTIPNLQLMLDSMSGFVEANKSATYEDWIDTSKMFGIADYEKAIEQAGITKAELERQYNTMQAQIGAQRKVAREEKEESFWKDTTEKTSEISETCTTHKDKLDAIRKATDDIMKSADSVVLYADLLQKDVTTIEGLIPTVSSLKSMLQNTVVSPIESKFNSLFESLSGQNNSTIGVLNTLSAKLDSILSAITTGTIEVHDNDLIQELINLHTNLVVDGDSTQNQIIRQLETLITMLQATGGSSLARLPFSLFALSGAANN